jgi:hypothetical protein
MVLFGTDVKETASRYTPEPDIGAVVIPDSDHYVLDSSLPKDLKGNATEAAVRTLTNCSCNPDRCGVV